MKHSLVVTLFLTIMFFASQLFGLLVTASYYDGPTSLKEGKPSWRDLPSVAGIEFERPDVDPAISVWYIFFAVLIGTFLILLIVKLGTNLLWKAWFLGAIIFCLHISFGAFLPSVYSLILAVLFGLWKVFRPNMYVHNVTELLVYGGLAVIFVPMLNVVYAFVTLILLSLYDMYAVWKSKHMIELAKFQTKSGLFAGFLLPYSLPKVGAKKGKMRTAVLGGGDVGFPLIFAGVIFAQFGLAHAVVVALSSSTSLFLLLVFSKKDVFYPAMPFLTLGCVIGFLVSLLL